MDNPVYAKSSMAKRPVQATAHRDESVTLPISPASDPVDGSYIALSVVTTEYTHIRPDESGHKTIGALIDNLIRDAAMKGNRVQSVALHLTDKDWRSLSKTTVELGNAYVAKE